MKTFLVVLAENNDGEETSFRPLAQFNLASWDQLEQTLQREPAGVYKVYEVTTERSYVVEATTAHVVRPLAMPA